MAELLREPDQVKVFILYLMDKIGYPLNYTDVGTIIIRDGLVDYFNFVENFRSLLENRHIQGVRADGTIVDPDEDFHPDDDSILYEITKKGKIVAEGIAAQSTVCGGGRYDGLVESLGGPALSGIGFGMGITRVIMAMEKEGLANIESPAPRLYIATLGDKAVPTAVAIAERLRRNGLYVECDLVGRSLKAQMKYANKLGADYTLILGDSEIESGKAFLRDMKNSEQTEIELATFTLK